VAVSGSSSERVSTTSLIPRRVGSRSKSLIEVFRFLDESLGPVLTFLGTEAVPVGTSSGTGRSSSGETSGHTFSVSGSDGVSGFQVEALVLAVTRSSWSVVG